MTYMLELCGSNWTTIVGIGYEFFWVVGWLSLGGLAYVLTNWRNLIMVTSAPGLLVVFYFCVLQESPKWILSVGRVEDAEHVTRRMAKLNGRSIPINWKLKKNPVNDVSVGKEKTCKVSFLDLFRTPQMCRKTLILYGNWFIISLTYYGLTLNSTDLGNDFHINFMINGAFEFPAYALALVLVRYTGRRIPYSLSLALSGKQKTTYPNGKHLTSESLKDSQCCASCPFPRIMIGSLLSWPLLASFSSQWPLASSIFTQMSSSPR